MPLPSLLVFGPQNSWSDAEYLSRLRAIFLLEPRLQSLADTIRYLPELWKDLLVEDPRLNDVEGLKGIRDLQAWVDGGEVDLSSAERTNKTSLPLTIICHLTQYFYYFDNDVEYPSQSRVLKSVEGGGIQGFCAGMLTAIAVASSKNEHEIAQYGAIALRLAFCVGVYVDLDSLQTQTMSLAVRWKRSATGHDRVREILKGYSDAYISVIVDIRVVTVVSPKAHIAALSQELSEEGMSVIPIGLEGRYHSATNKHNANRILKFCKSHADLSFPDARDLLVPVRANDTSEVMSKGSLNQLAVHCIMLELSNWYLTISSAVSDLPPTKSDNLIIGFGATKSLPLSFAKRPGFSIVEGKRFGLAPRKGFGDRLDLIPGDGKDPPVITESLYSEDAVAVVGMACKFPGADSVEEFWQNITMGTSMLAEMPAERFSTKGLRRTQDGKFRFFGNFVRDIAAFDHRFFKKSSRESASMDPQQRLLLECAYQALESAGDFGQSPKSVPDDTGCYIGVCTNDYNDNVASHSPNAYSSLGTLRAFIAGKISHYFGWSGPSLTFDTACSSSAVAIHDACRALQGGECSRAVAGGVNLCSSPYFYENLVSASFLSATGQTKPFDAKADGYARGEGAGLVVLKKLSIAIKAGDTIMGIISSSAINQNSNAVGITVPHSPSQAALYTRATNMAGVDPSSVSYVEAHGTGTPVGDPREIASIREVFGGARTDPLFVASVKGNIGHLEAASGIASLIKTLLMIKYAKIPVQASFKSLNPAIPALEPDGLIIPTSTQDWTTPFKVACINNYGASGSNATMIVCEPPPESSGHRSHVDVKTLLPKYPLFVSANSSVSLMSNCAAVQDQLAKLCNKTDSEELLSSFTYNLAVKQNRNLPHVLATSVSSVSEINLKLMAGASGTSSEVIQVPQKSKPTVLVFGGQVKDAVGLGKGLYDSSALFRSYLDKCNTILRSFGLKGLYPEIFQTTPVSDIVALQSMVFSLQISCAKTWMDSGLKVDAVIGHSLGQLAAMCISGTLSLEDGLKLVSGRASLMQKHWGSERGSMIAVETDSATLSKLMTTAREEGDEVEIACYNGPTSHVLVGREVSITKIQEMIRDKSVSTAPIKAKRLSVTHGFHSVFTEPLLPSLKTLAGELTFHDPVIPLETCSDGQSWQSPTPKSIADHTRTPVYFGQAVNRLTERLGPCTWLEAGSASSVIGMTRHALDPAVTSQHTFQAAELSNSSAVEALVNTTVNLWKQRHGVQLWQFHNIQRNQYSNLNLPPYQFEKNMHWLDWKEPSGTVQTVATPTEPVLPPPEAILLTFVNKDDREGEAEFSVDPYSKQWKTHVNGHAVLGEPLCPANMYVELSTQAAIKLNKGAAALFVPLIEGLEIMAPLGLAQDRSIKLVMTEKSMLSWTFEMSSYLRAEPSSSLSHAVGQITLQPRGSGLVAEFSRYEQLIGHDRFATIKSDPRCEVLQGAMVYKVFSKVVNYSDYYMGVRGVYSRDGVAVGTIVPPQQDDEGLKGMITSPLLFDSFIQVSGLHVNSLHECDPKQVFVCTKIDRIQVSPNFNAEECRLWDVYTNFTRPGERTVSNDIYVFDSSNRRLVVIIHGAFFTRVAMNSLVKVLSQANDRSGHLTLSSAKKSGRMHETTTKSVPQADIMRPGKASKRPSNTRNPVQQSPFVDLRELIHKVAEIPIEDLKDDKSFEDLGIDSLMVMEIFAEITKVFQVDLDPHDVETLPDIRSLANLLISKSQNGVADEEDSASSDSDGAFSGSTSSSSESLSSAPSDLEASDDVIGRLAKLLAMLLESAEKIDSGTNLAALGLDSLMCMELATDLKLDFGVDLEMHLITDDSTFGDLCHLVTSQPQPPKPTSETPLLSSVKPASSTKRTSMETVTYKQSGDLALKADIYYPAQVTDAKRPVALLMHGGGHMLYTRKDVNSKQIKSLLSHGFLAVSVDYRFCPEVTLLEGPMTDVRDALQWIRRELPLLRLDCPGLKIDRNRVAAIGWSTGGTLAMSLGFTPRLYGIEPPDAILGFYCPSNYDHDCFKHPIYPRDSISSPEDEYDLIDSVRNEPFCAYTPPTHKKGMQGSFVMDLADERWRLILHMNWKAQMVPILVNGLPSRAKLGGRNAESFKHMRMPSKEQVAAISPYAQILKGNYHTPTFIMHGTDDDLVPHQQSQQTIDALKAKGVVSGIATATGAGHLFDTFPAFDPTGTGVEAIRQGYAFLFRRFGLSKSPIFVTFPAMGAEDVAFHAPNSCKESFDADYVYAPDAYIGALLPSRNSLPISRSPLIDTMSVLIDSSITTPDGASIPYQVLGNPNPSSPLIVLSNPLLLTWAIWSLFLAAFFADPQNKRYRILTYQTRGRTDQYGTQDITLDVLAADIVSILDTIKVQKVAAIIGVSIGGATALNFALNYPERTESLVCSSIFAKSPPGMQQAWEERVAIATKEGARSRTGKRLIGGDLAEITVLRWFVPESFRTMPVEIAKIRGIVQTSSLDGFARIVKALYNFDLRAKMAKSPVKAAFLVGSEDAPLPRVMKDMARGFGSGAEFVQIDGSGHLPNFEKATEFAKIVTAFLVLGKGALQLNTTGSIAQE